MPQAFLHWKFCTPWFTALLSEGRNLTWDRIETGIEPEFCNSIVLKGIVVTWALGAWGMAPPEILYLPGGLRQSFARRKNFTVLDECIIFLTQALPGQYHDLSGKN
jgi:hypothetical protein